MTAAERLSGWARRVPRGAVYAAGALPAALLAWRAATGGLGVDPVKALEHELGLVALQFLVATLAMTPLRRLAGVNLLKHRRPLGVLAFAYAVLHFLVWLVLDMQFLWGQIGADLVKRPYITIGMLGLAAMIPLAVTSNDGALRRMGAAAWRRLHRLAYLAGLAGAVHYLMVVKAWPPEPILYLAAVLALLALRVGRRRARVAG